MSLPAETWRYVGSAIPAAATISGVLDALYTLGTSATYHDASSRTPGAGVAGTWARKQVTGTTEAVYCNPVTNSHTIRWIFAGSSSARTPTMITTPADTWATSTVLFGWSRSGSTLNATGNGWDQTLPFDTGSLFTGYARALASSIVSTTTKVHLWECGTACVVAWQTATATVRTWVGMLDPGVTNATSPNTAEATSEGRYWFATNGTTTVDSTTSWTSATSVTGVCFAHAVTVNGNHCYVIDVGTATLRTAERTFETMNDSTTTTQTTQDGDFVTTPIHLGANAGGYYFGRMREIEIGPDTTLPLIVRSSSVIKAYGVSSSPSAASDTAWVKH